MSVLSVEGLGVDIATARGTLHAVRDVSFRVERGETLCLVGESGCGKSMTAFALMGLLPRTATRTARALSFEGEDLTRVPAARLSHLRGNRMAMIFQEPMTALNPAYTIGDQLGEVLRRHQGATRRAARERAVELLGKVGITAAAERLAQYPHQLSGGLRQRVMIAMALMCAPAILIADEPTTALDVTIQAQVLDLIDDLRRELGMAVVLITHDLGIVAERCDRVAVMYAGQVVELGRTGDVVADPRHPYTRGLIDALPRIEDPDRALVPIEGRAPALEAAPTMCRFLDRCPRAAAECRVPVPLGRLDGGRLLRCVRAFAPVEAVLT
jgi:peptide/nickel transport system ATP-binding protein